MSDLPIPTSKEDLTQAWLTQALQYTSGMLKDPVYDIDVETIGTGIGLIGGLYRCTIHYSPSSQIDSTSIVVKIRTDDPQSLKVAKTFLLYQKEVAFYRNIASLASMRVPKVYYSDFDPKSHDFVLLLEDLKDLQVCSQLRGGTAEQGKLAIRHLAKLHAQFWQKEREPPLNTYFSLVKPSFTIKIHIGFRHCVTKVLDIFDADLSPDSKDLIRAFGDTLAGHYREIGQGPKTLNHGDYRIDNMFFNGQGNNELVVIDWQTNGIGVGMSDVSYFMAGSLEPEVRRRIEREIVSEYHEITYRDGGAQWSLDECWHAYRKSYVTAMTVPVIAAGQLSLDNERAFELVQKGLKRMNAAIEELDVAEFMPQRRSIWSLSGFQSALANRMEKLATTNSM